MSVGPTYRKSIGEKASGAGDVLGTPLTDSNIKDHDVVTSDKPDVSVELHGPDRLSCDTSLKASAVGENVGMSIIEGVRSSDMDGESEVGTLARLLEGDVGIGTVVINSAVACIGNALVGILAPVTTASEKVPKNAYIETDSAIILLGEVAVTVYRNNRILDSNVRANSPEEPVNSPGTKTDKNESPLAPHNKVSEGDVDRGGSPVHNHPLGEGTIVPDEGRFSPVCILDVKPNSVNPTCAYPPMVSGVPKDGSDTSSKEEGA